MLRNKSSSVQFNSDLMRIKLYYFNKPILYVPTQVELGRWLVISTSKQIKLKKITYQACPCLWNGSLLDPTFLQAITPPSYQDIWSTLWTFSPCGTRSISKSPPTVLLLLIINLLLFGRAIHNSDFMSYKFFFLILKNYIL